MKNSRFLPQWTLVILVVFLVLSGCATRPPVAGDQNTTAVRARAKAHTDLGAAYFQQKKYEIALEEFSKAANIDPTFGFAYNGLGLVNAALRQDKAADRYFKRAIAIAPNNSEAHNNYGNFLCSRGRYAASIDEYLIAVKNPLYSTPVAAYTNAGICAKRGGEATRAGEFFKKALQIDPVASTAAYELALMQFKQNEAANALKTLQPALQAKLTARGLYLGMKLAQVDQQSALAIMYRRSLLRDFPNSKEALELRQAN